MDYIKFGTGAIPSEYDCRDFRINADSVNDSDYGSEFIIDTLKIKNQGAMPTCVPHCIAEIAEYRDYVRAGLSTTFSTQFIYGMKSDDSRLEFKIRDALKIAQKYGNVTYDVLPGNDKLSSAHKIVQLKYNYLMDLSKEHRFPVYYRLMSDSEIKYALVNHGPVITGIKMYSKSSLDNSNVYICDYKQSYTCHAVLIVGWRYGSWYMQNSWGTNWGNKGYFYVPMESGLSHLFFDTFGVTDDLSDIVKNTKSPLSCKIINNIVNKLIHHD